MQSAFIGSKQVIANSRIRPVCADEQITRRFSSIFKDRSDSIIIFERLNAIKPFPELEAITLNQSFHLALKVRWTHPQTYLNINSERNHLSKSLPI